MVFCHISKGIETPFLTIAGKHKLQTALNNNQWLQFPAILGVRRCKSKAKTTRDHYCKPQVARNPNRAQATYGARFSTHPKASAKEKLVRALSLSRRLWQLLRKSAAAICSLKQPGTKGHELTTIRSIGSGSRAFQAANIFLSVLQRVALNLRLHDEQLPCRSWESAGTKLVEFRKLRRLDWSTESMGGVACVPGQCVFFHIPVHPHAQYFEFMYTYMYMFKHSVHISIYIHIHMYSEC